MRKRFLLLLFLLILPPAWAGNPVILVLGDSLSAGYGLPPGEGWVDLLEQRLERQGYPHDVVNASVSGDTTAGGLARLPRALERHGADVLLIVLGGNDGLRGVQPAETRSNLARMIELGQRHGAQVLIAQIRLPPNYGPAFGARFERMFQELSRDHQAPLIPFIPNDFGGSPGLVQDDGLHPSAEAQPLLLENVWPLLEQALDPAM